MTTLEELRFPIGKFTRPDEVSNEEYNKYISEIDVMPRMLRKSSECLNENQLNTPYREGGWTVRQVVHHLSDSHANSFIRLKLALTEDNPTIKPYDETTWAELYDAKHAPVELSLAMIEGLHTRWAMNLRHLTPEQKKRTFNHPESGVWRIEQHAAMYAWHGKHHIAHITELRTRMGW